MKRLPALLSVILSALPSMALADQLENCKDAEIRRSVAPRSTDRGADRFERLLGSFKKPDVVLIGDSLVRMWSTATYMAAFGTTNVLNLGVSGDRTENTIWRLGKYPLQSISPRRVVILLGTNNLRRGSPCGLLAGVTEVVNKAHEAWPGAKITVIGMLRRGTDFKAFDADRISINAKMAAMAYNSSWLSFVDASEELTCGGTWPCVNYKDDALHLTPSGYARLANIIGQKP